MTGRTQDDEGRRRDADAPDQSTGDGTEQMTAAEEAGQVAFGAKDTSGETGATGAESSSG